MYGVDSLPYLAILTGIICLIVFLLKWERYVLLVPSSVMEGFTVGVAFIIGLNQVLPAGPPQVRSCVGAAPNA
jgi:SulP family sulfate permease